MTLGSYSSTYECSLSYGKLHLSKIRQDVVSSLILSSNYKDGYAEKAKILIKDYLKKSLVLVEKLYPYRSNPHVFNQRVAFLKESFDKMETETKQFWAVHMASSTEMPWQGKMTSDIVFYGHHDFYIMVQYPYGSLKYGLKKNIYSDILGKKKWPFMETLF